MEIDVVGTLWAAVTNPNVAYVLLVLGAAVRAQRLALRSAPQAVIGERGVATTPVDPVGTVQVRSELWTAIADEPIGVGEEVEVEALEGHRHHHATRGHRRHPAR